MFCERYRDRGIAGRVHADAARQEKKEALTRAIAPGAYIGADELAAKEKKLDSYRTGKSSDGKRYMTADDFARYYHDQRGYKYPQYRTVTDAERIAAVQAVVAANSRETRLEQPKKAGWLTDTDKIPAFLKKLMTRPFFVRLNEWAGETFPREAEMRCESRESGARRSHPIPAGLVAALVTVVVSMTRVITSTVSVSRATREVSELKQNVAELHEVHGELSDQLHLKNDMLAIEDKATNELGMVHEKYLNGEYLTEKSEDYMEVYDEDGSGGKKTGLSWLLSAFGIGD
jgi:cell division protein FtsB